MTRGHSTFGVWGSPARFLNRNLENRDNSGAFGTIDLSNPGGNVECPIRRYRVRRPKRPAARPRVQIRGLGPPFGALKTMWNSYTKKNDINNHDFGVNFWGNVGEIIHIFSIF